MAPKPSPNSLIHCAVCGEDYSATYRRCPFCGAKNAPAPAHTPAPPPVHRRAPDPEPEPTPGRRTPADPDDTYVFDGQDLFDEEYEEDYRPARPKGGKRLAEKPAPSLFANADINWPRMITFLCSLIIIVAALVIVFTVIYPQLRGDRDPAAAGSESPGVTEPVGNPTQPVEPGATDPVQAATDPVVDPTGSLPTMGVGDDEPTGLKIVGRDDVTLRPGAGSNQYQLNVAVTPADWGGTITYRSSDSSLATVSPTGLITHAKPDVTGNHRVIITAQAGTLEVECTVYITGASSSQASNPPASDPPAQSDPPVATQPPSGGNVTVGRTGTIVGADSGLRVRSGPGTNYEVVASLLNGNTVTVVADAGGGWYQISFSGSGGSTMTGYIMGEYISTN